jgi:hypothetical protein
MSDLSDGLERIAGEGWDTSGRRQSELVNLSFTLRDARLVKYVYEGEERQAYVGTIAIDGSVEEVFLRGAICTKQINWLIASGKLPAPLKLVRDSERFGSPYVLKADEPARAKGTDDGNAESPAAAGADAAARAA